MVCDVAEETAYLMISGGQIEGEGRVEFHGLLLEQWFSTCGSQPFYGCTDPITGVVYQISCISDIYTTIHNQSKISYKVTRKMIFAWEGSHRNVRNCIKGS